MDQLVTLIDKDISKMNKRELKRELKVQKFMLNYVHRSKEKFIYLSDQADKPSNIREDKIEYFAKYEKMLEAQIAEIEYYIPRRSEEVKEWHSMTPQERQARRRRRKEYLAMTNTDYPRRYKWLKQINKDGINLSWDRDKFMLVARDRGYMTEESVIYAVGQEINLDRTRTVSLLKLGKFTWGQVLCIGALLEMTPKEFCDIFLCGYFVEMFGEYRASYENVDKTELLKRVVNTDTREYEARQAELRRIQRDIEKREKKLEAVKAILEKTAYEQQQREKALQKREVWRMNQIEKEESAAEYQRMLEYFSNEDNFEVIEVESDGSPIE